MYYYSFSSYLREHYGCKVRRISLDAGFSCPNKDGKAGRGGCIYCNELAFSPFAGKALTLDEQITRSISSAKERGIAEKFIAYFQNATNTYAETQKLKAVYDVIKKYPEIVALSISTRPDCVDEEKLDLIESYKNNYEVWVEYGIQSVHDRTLLAINRGHTFGVAEEAIKKTAERGIKVGVHVILGLPGENREDMIATAGTLAQLPVDGVKLHVLHVLKGTALEGLYKEGKVQLLGREEYAGLACDFLENTPPDRVILRLVSDAARDVLIAPEWINDKLSIISEIETEFSSRKTSQGSLCYTP